MIRSFLILGAGGHAQVVADILLRMRDAGEPVSIIGFLDDDQTLTGKFFLGLPVLGTLADRVHIAHDFLIVAVGDNRTRAKIFQHCRREGSKFGLAKHPMAVMAQDVQVGDGSMICAGVVVNPQTTIGVNAILNTGCTVDHHSCLADHVHIAPGANMGGEVHVGEGALVGIGATVMPRRKIGAWSIVGAGSLVHEDVPDGAVVVGVPARRIS